MFFGTNIQHVDLRLSTAVCGMRPVSVMLMCGKCVRTWVMSCKLPCYEFDFGQRWMRVCVNNLSGQSISIIFTLPSGKSYVSVSKKCVRVFEFGDWCAANCEMKMNRSKEYFDINQHSALRSAMPVCLYSITLITLYGNVVLLSHHFFFRFLIF